MDLHTAIEKSLSKLTIKQPKVLIAVSGGPDSIALLYACVKLGLDINAAHANFMLRDSESFADENFVKSVCKKLKVPLHVKHFNLNDLKKQQNNSNTQSLARNVRYDWFNQLVNEFNFDYIFTAHHQNDQVETIIHRLIRGAGVTGLMGIKFQNEKIVRPILSVTKQLILDYLTINKIDYQIDSSNLKNNYTRNTLRNIILPKLKEINNNADLHLLQLASVAADTHELIVHFISQHPDIISNQNDKVVINKIALAGFPFYHLIYYHILQPRNFLHNQVTEICSEHINQNAKWTSTTHTCYYNRGHFIIEPLTLNQPIEISVNEFPATFSIGAYTYHLNIVSNVNFNINNTSGFVLSFDHLTLPLQLRQKKDGDKIKLSGINGNKKVSDLLIDLKCSPIEKKEVIIIESAGNVVAVLPYRISELVYTSEKTKKLLSISINKTA
ncbi:MAG: tRNA lysidine(34) synthetase TilS [Bacteroidia bacterium]|jgi:tRNA(Ile)-lysidine synthase|nr:tRNA lysidine(34) synthetase TilS [Bacteroidia bacterium]